jgi:carbamoyltransferase
MDLAASIQVVTEDIVMKMAQHAHRLTGEAFLCLAGGVALNCVANGKLLREGPFKDIWIQPAAGDAGGAVGAALVVWHHVFDKPRAADDVHDGMRGAYLGPSFTDAEIQSYLDSAGCKYRRLSEAEWAPAIAKLLNEAKVVGLLQGRMEFGPRALGARSILGDARSSEMQSVMNLKIKYRESFRPFAPACLLERVGDFFELDRPSPYMLLVAQVNRSRCVSAGDSASLTLRERINQARSDVPAITHVDWSARIQTVAQATNPRFHAILKAFEDLTGYGVLINTSFNVRGEPIVCTPADAFRCFMRTEMDYLVLGSFLLNKKDQSGWKEQRDWRKEFVLD